MHRMMMFVTAAILCACTPVTGDDAQVSVLLTASELRAVLVATEYGPYSTTFTESADMRRSLQSARQKMIGLSAATQ